MDTSSGSVSVPQIDLVHYVNVFLAFLVDHYPAMVSFTKSTISFLVTISFPLSVVLIIGIILSIERIKKIRRLEAKIYDAHTEDAYADVTAPDPALAQRWRKVLELAESQNENDWRQAIMEADILLDEILVKMGYQGVGVGERLQRVEPADFQTLDQAWEAHKIRNAIAHEGSNFILTQREGKRVVNLYRQVFEEFFYI